jgi:hypothetical protein
MATIAYSWICRTDELADEDGSGSALGAAGGAAVEGLSYAHMATVELLPGGVVAAAWQASAAGREGAPGQHLRFATSRDAGRTFGPSRCPMHGLGALWAPVLHYDGGAAASAVDLHISAGAAAKAEARLLLFYAESRKVLSPGGDIKCISSADMVR